MNRLFHVAGCLYSLAKGNENLWWLTYVKAAFGRLWWRTNFWFGFVFYVAPQRLFCKCTFQGLLPFCINFFRASCAANCAIVMAYEQLGPCPFSPSVVVIGQSSLCKSILPSSHPAQFATIPTWLTSALTMEAVCSSVPSNSNSSVHGLITQMTRMWLALKMVTQKTGEFWNVTPCSIVCVEVDWHFSGTCCSVTRVYDTAAHSRRHRVLH